MDSTVTELEEPKIEFIAVEMNDIVTTSAGSAESCVGGDAPMNNCSSYGAMMVG